MLILDYCQEFKRDCVDRDRDKTKMFQRSISRSRRQNRDYSVKGKIM